MDVIQILNSSGAKVIVAIKSDQWIRDMCLKNSMITPYADDQIKHKGAEGVISYGLSSYGYDVRVAKEFKIFANRESAVIDPKNFQQNVLITQEVDVCIIPPNGFVLARTVERLCVPRNILVVCVGKSTYARCGIIVNVTPLEPGWEGYVTLELSNTTPLPVKIYANEGICQMLFFESDQECSVSYADRSGKYMHQEGITLPKV